MRRSILYIGIAIFLVALSTSATAQEVSSRTIYDNVSQVVYREVYDDGVEIISYNNANDNIRWRHNLRIGVGTSSLVASALIDDGIFDDYYYDIIHYELGDRVERQRYVLGPVTNTPCLFAEYTYQLKPWLAIGGKVSFDAIWRAMYDVRTGLRVCNRDKYVISTIANFRFDWLRRRNVQLYSSIGAGIAMRIEHANNQIVPMFDATFIGFSAGRSFYCFWELGGGISGIARAGIGIRFNTKNR